MTNPHDFLVLVSTYSGHGILDMLVGEFGIATIRNSLDEIAAQENEMENVVDQLFEYIVSIVGEILFGSGNTSAPNMRIVRWALERLQVRENLEEFIDTPAVERDSSGVVTCATCGTGLDVE